MNPVESGCGRRRQKDWSLICQLSSKHGLLRRSAERQGFFRPLRCFSFWARKRKHIFARVIFSRGRLSLSMGQLCACAAASCPTGFKTVGSKASCALRPCLGKRSLLVVSMPLSMAPTPGHQQSNAAPSNFAAMPRASGHAWRANAATTRRRRTSAADEVPCSRPTRARRPGAEGRPSNKPLDANPGPGKGAG